MEIRVRQELLIRLRRDGRTSLVSYAAIREIGAECTRLPRQSVLSLCLQGVWAGRVRVGVL